MKKRSMSFANFGADFTLAAQILLTLKQDVLFCENRAERLVSYFV